MANTASATGSGTVAPSKAGGGPFVLPPGPRRAHPEVLVRWTLQPIAFLDEQRARWGDSFTLRVLPGQPPMVWLSDPDAVRDVFSADADLVHVGEANQVVEAVLRKNSLLLLDGEAHRRQRRLMMPPFHGDRMRAYGQAMREATARAMARWTEGGTVVLLDEMQVITLDVILRTVFGIEDADQHAHLGALLRELMERGSNKVLFLASILLGSARVARAVTAASQPLRLGPLSVDPGPLVPGNKLFRIIREVDQLLLAEFARRRAEDAPRTDVLSLLMSARDESGAPMSDDELRDELMTLLLAGHETTAITLAWALHHLMTHADVLARLHAELAAADAAAGGQAGPDALQTLDYLDAVVKETMRLTPVVPLVARVPQRDATFGRYHVPKGSLVAPAIWLTHHRADLYPEPDSFRPERFAAWKPGPHEFFPFGGGLRRCVGAAFATYEIKVVLAEVLRRARLEPAGDPVRLERRGIMFAPSGGTRATVLSLS